MRHAGFRWTEDDEESLRVLKLGGALGIFLMLAYLAYDQHMFGKQAPGMWPHWLILAATCLFFGLSWTDAFKRHWKFWILLYNLFLIATFILISGETGDPESRFIAIMLCPLATAAFVSWGTGWQFLMAFTAVRATRQANISCRSKRHTACTAGWGLPRR